MSWTKDHRKQSLYLPADMLEELRRESERLERSLSWCVQFVWRHGRHELAKLQSPSPEGT